MHQVKLFIISAPSGTGKTTVVNETIDHFKNTGELKICRLITFTTRKIRQGEIAGIDYHFITIEDFKNKIEARFFLEWSVWYEDYYGTPSYVLNDLLNKTASYLLIIDRCGARAIKETFSDVILIWMYPPSIEELERRLQLRNTDTKNVISLRLQKAEVELNQENIENLYKYKVECDSIENGKNKLISIIKLECFCV